MVAVLQQLGSIRDLGAIETKIMLEIAAWSLIFLELDGPKMYISH
jgi:hypothetical protein